MEAAKTMSTLPTQTMGRLLRNLRDARKLSLRDLGALLKDPETGIHVSAAFLSDIENGRRFPSEKMLEDMAEILRVEIADLKACDPRPPAREIQELATMNPQYAFAFRQIVRIAVAQRISPQELLNRVSTLQ